MQCGPGDHNGGFVVWVGLNGVGVFSLPRKVLEMNSDTWFPDRLISDRCVNSRFSILLNCNRERGRLVGGVGGGGEKKM